MLRITLKSHSTIFIFTRSHEKMWVSYVNGTPKMSQIGSLVYGITHFELRLITICDSLTIFVNSQNNTREYFSNTNLIYSNFSPGIIFYIIFCTFLWKKSATQKTVCAAVLQKKQEYIFAGFCKMDGSEYSLSYCTKQIHC